MRITNNTLPRANDILYGPSWASIRLLEALLSTSPAIFPKSTITIVMSVFRLPSSRDADPIPLLSGAEAGRRGQLPDAATIRDSIIERHPALTSLWIQARSTLIVWRRRPSDGLVIKSICTEDPGAYRFAPSDWTLDALTLDLLPHSSNIGFFLDVHSIQRSFITSTTIIPSLRTALHLWSAHLSDDLLISTLEPNLLSRAISETISPTRTLSDAAPNINSTHQIQASILLSTYFFRNARLVEGRYHLSRATASATVLASRTSGPAQTEIRLREALLTTQALTCCWESANASLPEPSLPPPTTSSDILAQYASAAHLYRRATLLASQTSRECIPDKFAVSLEIDQALADADVQSLPSASPRDRDVPRDTESEPQTRILIPALLHSAQIHVFSALLEEHAYARQKSRAAAHMILSLLVQWGEKHRDEGMSGRLLDPMFAPICASSCRVLISEIARRRRGRDSSESSLDADLNTKLKPLLDALHVGIRIMRKHTFPLMGRKRVGGGEGVV
uniref:Uncharacterized protein n=1 Tax=Mycena chlorophos TaxID=658473 RepID=A0ABQ0LG80_MYCCL|nr:predicted protein [Mycena chlorophos]